MKFILTGKIKGKARPRFSTANGYVRSYTPKTTTDYERAVKDEFRYNHAGFGEKAVSVEIYAFFKIPKSYTKKKCRESLDGVFCQKKPDSDNIAKIVCDGLNGVAYQDDKQVVDCRVVKKWTEGEERIEVEINEIVGRQI